ncbi:MAG: esterase-like activity of phytase family protein [Boseongicola sp.]|nr:MAG: esterase-like activity of phytase family protein [Boseongicola sp.]
MRASLVALILWAMPAVAEPKLEHIGTFVWDRPEDYFGGWSAIEVLDGGDVFLAIGDNAQSYRGTLERDGDVIVGVPRRPVGALQDLDGIAFFRKPATNEKKIADSEGMALLSDGNYAVSFERNDRIFVYDGDTAFVRMPDIIDAQRLPKNQGVEALAVDLEGRLIAIPETAPKGASGIPVWRLEGEKWSTLFHIRRTQGFRPVGADIGPDGQLFLLERAFRLIGFQSRIRVFDLKTPDALGDAIWQPPMRAFDNLEGISVWQDKVGSTRITMISDDNHQSVQETQIVEFRLTE